MTKKRIHTLYGIVLSVMLAVAGICLCVACVGIYLSGEQPFSREAVAAAFGYIAVPVYLCLALVLGGFLLDGFYPSEQKKSPEKQYRMILSGLRQKLALDSCDAALAEAIMAERKKQRLHKAIPLGLLIAGSAVFLSYGLNPSNFHQSEINRSMVQAMGLFVPCLGIPFCCGVVSGYLSNRSIQREIELTKQALTGGARATPAGIAPKSGAALVCLRLALLCLGIVILVYGFFAGGTADVMTKAVNICTECVGLG